MLISILRNGLTVQTMMDLLARVFVVFCTLPIHEYAHAYIATKLGDHTARLSGRLTLNPLKHLDLIGTLMILFVGFGYAKPVPVNPRNFKNQKGGMALTALAGPVSNLLLAVLMLLLSNVALLLYYNQGGATVWNVAMYFFYYAGYINVSLAVFNLLPIPPLDGSRILGVVLPDRIYYKVMQYERYIMIGVFVLLMTGLLTRPLSWITGLLVKGIDFVVSLPFPFS